MITTTNQRIFFTILCLSFSFSAVRADEPARSAGEPGKKATKSDSKSTTTSQQIRGVSLFDAARSGAVTVDAEGTGDGRIAIVVSNNTNRKLKVVLPPGLVASGATGQFGGMGGMGGGMGGMGGMGGGMGGMGGGMGGMGGGMGGMGGRGGMGGGMGGGQMLTMPPTMGLMMVGRLIMTLVEPTESWNPRTLMMGMMGMMGGMGGGMGGMGGGMGGMGGGMGGMGGMMSVPPTDLPNATINPGQTRRLATRVVSLNAPSPESGVIFPQQGEKLVIGDITQISSDSKVQKALRRLAADKAPDVIAQLVLWNLAAKIDWVRIEQLSSGWANAQELDLAKHFVEKIDSLPEGESGQLLIEIVAHESVHEKLATELNKKLSGQMILGLKVNSKVPEKPTSPSVGCKVRLVGDPEKPEAIVQVAASDGYKQWKSMGKFNLPVALNDKGERDLMGFSEQLSEKILNLLVRPKMIKGREPIAGVPTYTLQIDNGSPLLLNGFAIVGVQAKKTDQPHVSLGFSLPPQKSLQMSLTPTMVDAYGMKKGTRLIALDLSGL